MSRELGAVVISVSYRIGPFHQFPAAIHDAEDVLSAILDTDGITDAGRVLRTEIQRYYTIMRSSIMADKKTPTPPHMEHVTTLTLDPERLCISGFSAGGNIALNMAMSAPPSLDVLTPDGNQAHSLNRRSSMAKITSLSSNNRRATILDDPCRPWPSVLPSPRTRPRMLPLLLFYPSLDARLLPHERPMKALPNALKGDDHHVEQPKKPGLFSIMGPTYLPQKLRAHPRASPGLVDPDNIQKNAAILLVLPEKDSLAVQSDVWVDGMNSSDWHGPVRFGDGREGDWDGPVRFGDRREGDWDGRNGGPAYPKTEKNGGLEIWHAPGCRHGWTQFPDPIAHKHERAERDLVFARTLDFVKEAWTRELPVPAVERLGNGAQESRPLEAPSQSGGLYTLAEVRG